MNGLYCFLPKNDLPFFIKKNREHKLYAIYKYLLFNEFSEFILLHKKLNEDTKKKPYFPLKMRRISKVLLTIFKPIPDTITKQSTGSGLFKFIKIIQPSKGKELTKTKLCNFSPSLEKQRKAGRFTLGFQVMTEELWQMIIKHTKNLP